MFPLVAVNKLKKLTPQKTIVKPSLSCDMRARCVPVPCCRVFPEGLLFVLGQLDINPFELMAPALVPVLAPPCNLSFAFQHVKALLNLVV